MVGYINFPKSEEDIIILDGKTTINIVSFDINNIEYSNSNLFLNGIFVSDDVFNMPNIETSKDVNIDDLIRSQVLCNNYNDLYFPNLNNELIPSNDIMKYISIPLLSSNTIGFSRSAFEKRSGGFWNAGFEDLSDNGKDFFYNIKKLYNDKEVRILTFVDEII